MLLNPARYKHIGSGRNRDVYLCPSGLYVVKDPSNDAGCDDNYSEAYRWKRRSKWYPLARCKMVPNSPLLIMEYVKTDFVWSKEMPDWIDFVDCRQVGYTLDGKLVAYDYGMY
jgi:hypothetical protein